MRIKLFSTYRNADGVFLTAGEYDANDPALQGLAGYLVSSKHAVEIAELKVIDGKAKEPEKVKGTPGEKPEGGEPVTGTVEETVDLSTLTKKALIELAAERGIDLGNAPEKKTNAQLIELIEAANVGTPIEPIQGEGGEA